MDSKTVVVAPFFGTCKDTCPVVLGNIQAIAAAFGDRLGKDLVILTITVDPEHDTAEALAVRAKELEAPAGWYLLTGTTENVHLANSKLGQHVDTREAHDAVLKIGNTRTGLWKKAYGMAPRSELIEIVQSVIDDMGPE
jgi:protein SCO1/2